MPTRAPPPRTLPRVTGTNERTKESQVSSAMSLGLTLTSSHRNSGASDLIQQSERHEIHLCHRVLKRRSHECVHWKNYGKHLTRSRPRAQGTPGGTLDRMPRKNA